MKIFSLIACLVLLFVSCANPTVLQENVFPVQSVESLNDSIFFHGVSSLTFDGQRLFIPCGDKVVITNAELELLSQNTKNGEGPDEFVDVRSVATFGERMFFYDLGTRSFKEYAHSNMYHGAFEDDRMQGVIVNEKFFATSSSIVAPGPLGIYELALDGKEAKSLFEFEKHTKSSVLEANGQLIIIDHSYPSIILFDQEGRSFQKYDYADIDFVANTLAKIDRNNGGTYMLVTSAELKGEKLFLLLSQTSDKGYRSNDVLVFDIRNLRKGHIKHYKLPEKVYTAITLIESVNRLVTFSYTSSQLQVFALD